MDDKAGTISIDQEKATITFERHLTHPIEKVWEAITDPEKRAFWFGPTTIDPREGGVMKTVAEGPPAPEAARRTVAKILVWDPPHLFEYEELSSNVGRTIVRFELSSRDNTTILRLKNTGFQIPDASGYAPGWHAFLDRLDSHLAGDKLPDWTERYAIVQSFYKN